MLDAADTLGPDGPFVQDLKGFRPRAQQQEMANTVAEIIDEFGVLVSEAGTGTGKTLAYLVPALLSGRKIIVSTATKTLQEQLYFRDLPLVRKALAVPVQFAMLKGRSNYLCRYRLELAEQSESLQPTVHARHIRKIKAWAGITRRGDIEEINDIPDGSPVWFQVTSTTDNCLGQECPEISACHLVKARRAAQESDVLVINHHLLFSDMMLKEEGFGELLPDADCFILDEAHQLPETASRFFGIAVSGHQFLELGRDVMKAYYGEAGDTPALLEAVEAMEKAMRDLRIAMGRDQQRAPWARIYAQPAVREQTGELQSRLEALQAILAQLAERGKGLENCWQRSVTLSQRLGLFTTAGDEQHITWFETTKRSFVLYDTPMEVSDTFSSCMAHYKSAWVFTSATLAVGNRFDHFISRLGIEDAQEALWQSPFDYEKNALLYLPEKLPQPGERSYIAAIVEAAMPVLTASGGRTFFLFTSHRALREADRLLQEKGLAYPLLVQGSAPRRELLEQFRTLGNAVLLGTSSFWEGVDVRGSALSCVIVDKLPFAPPDDPVFQARAAALEKKGGNPFREYQLPNAVITLKQGVGRLIRDVHDRGVLMLCDPRLISRSYGKVFIKNLPTMKITRTLDDVVQFFDLERETAVSEEIKPPTIVAET